LVRDRIREMLRTIDLDPDPRIDAQEIDFHSSPAVECNGQVGVHLEYSARLRQSLETSIQECLGRASRAIGAFGFRRNRTSRRHEQARERRIDTVPNESSHAGYIVSFPQWIGRQSYVCGPTRNGAAWKPASYTARSQNARSFFKSS
jgi:hypothetical protein